MISAYGAFYRVLFIVLLTPRWISVGTPMLKIVKCNAWTRT